MKIFYVGLFGDPDSKLFNFLQSIVETRKNYEVIFVGANENKYEGPKKYLKFVKTVWTFKHYVLPIYKYVRKNNPDIVHVNFELRVFGSVKAAVKFPLLLLLLKSKTKIVVTIHQIFIVRKEGKWELFQDHDFIKLPIFLKKILIKLFLKLYCNFCDRIVVYNSAAKLGLMEYYGIESKKISVSNLSILSDTKPKNYQFYEEIQKKFKDRKIILSFGLIAPRKSLEIAIKSFKKIEKELSGHVLVIAGRSVDHFKWYENELELLVKKLNLENKIVFIRNLNDDQVKSIFKIAEIILYSNKHYSGGSYAILHAIHHQKPIIATKIDAFTDVLEDNQALFVEPEDEGKMAIGILEMISNNQLRENFIKNLKENSKNVSCEKNAADYIQIFDELLSKRNN